MSADTYEELKARLEWVLQELQFIKMDMFGTDCRDKLEDIIEEVKEGANNL